MIYRENIGKKSSELFHFQLVKSKLNKHIHTSLQTYMFVGIYIYVCISSYTQKMLVKN
jgi:hypothetical protein